MPLISTLSLILIVSASILTLPSIKALSNISGIDENYIRSYTNDGIVHCTLCGKIIDLKAPGTAIEIINEIDIDSLTVKDLKSMIEVIKLYCIKPEEYENIYTIIFNASLFLDKIKPICNFITSKFKKDGKFEVTDEFYNNVMEMDNMPNSILSTIQKYNE